MRRGATIGALAALCIILATAVSAESEPLAEALQELRIDETTRQQIRDRLRDSADAAAERRAEIAHEKATLLRLLGEDSPDPKAVLEAADRLSKLEAETRRSRLEALLEIRAMLSPEQRRALLTLRSRSFGPAVAACHPEVRRLCPDASGLLLESLRCLRDRSADLSSACREALEERGSSLGP